jgi:hypothetical protein
MSVDNLLNRLQKVKRTSNNSWMACCPAHDDRNPSLAVKDADGKVLLKCMAGCSASDILGSLGMDFADIMPPSQPVQHKATQPPQKIYATDAIKAIKFESQIVCLAAYDLRKGIKPNDVDMARLDLAMERINTALEMVYG